MKKILVIDDSKTTLAMLSAVLKGAGYEVAVCEKGSQGYVMAQQVKPDLVILDLILPDINGIDLLTDLRGDSATKDIPVAILTGRDSPDEALKGTQLGAVGYLVKYNTMPRMVLDKVKGWIGPPA